MPLDAAFKIIFNIHLSTLSLPSHSLCLLHTTSNFLPFLLLEGKDLFNLHCPRVSSSYKHRGTEEFSTICHDSKIGFWGWVFFLGAVGKCRWGPFLICLQFIRRQPKAHNGRLHLPVHQPGTGGWYTDFQSCLLPKSGIYMPEKNLTCKDHGGPCKSQKGERDCLTFTSWQSPVGPTAFWIWRLNGRVKDVNSFTELSTAELKEKAWPLQWLVSRGLQQQEPHRQQHVSQSTRVTTAFVVWSTFDNAAFPQPLTYSSSSHYSLI